MPSLRVRSSRPTLVLGCAILLFARPAPSQSSPPRESAARAVGAIRPSWIEPHVRFLADAGLKGRDTGSPGYQIAANYVAAQFELLGLRPGGDGGTYFQRVPIRQSLVASASLSVTDTGGTHPLQYDRDFFVHASGAEDGIDASGPLVFVGYGVSLPAYRYDDYAGIDVRGKIVVFLPGTPPTLPRDVRAVASLPGRRVRDAKAHGALAVIQLMPAANASGTREHQIRQLNAIMWRDSSGHAHSAFFGDAYAIVPSEGATALLRGQPHTMAEITARLAKGPFSFDLGETATLHAHFVQHDTATVNVAAVLPGRDPGEGYVVYSAHLDHDGVSTFFKGDSVLHGALDNAGGVATILAAARAFTQTRTPRRSILFLAVTGEEKGLVGSDYFVHHPTVPRTSIVADINCDNFLWYVPVKDISGLGASYSSLEADFDAAAARAHIRASPPITPMPHLFVLTDHFPFIDADIPAVTIFNGARSGDGTRNGTQIFADYMRDVHHTPRDSMDQSLDWNAAVTETRFAFLLGDQVANDAQAPRFNQTAFFRAMK